MAFCASEPPLDRSTENPFFMRVPTVFFQSADNQRYDREFFEAGERMIFAGDMTQDRDICQNIQFCEIFCAFLCIIPKFSAQKKITT